MRKRGLILFSLLAPVLFFSIGSLGTQIVSAESPNLFSNSSAEISAGQQPQAWNPDSWGGTRATFTRPSGGAQDGNRFLTTTVTKKGGGDAKWYPTHVLVTPGETYTFSDWYKSDVKSGVDIEYILINGSYRYVHLANPAASSEWKKYQTTFVVPARAKKLTVLHYIDRVGTLSVDNYSLTTGTSTPPPPPQQKPTIVSFSANPISIVTGSSTVLSWNVINASSTSISGVGVVIGTIATVTPTQTRDYVLTATNPAGSVSATTTVTVTPVQPPPSPASISISNSPTPAAQNVLANVPNQPLGGFTTTITGESISVQSMSFAVATSSTGPGLLTNITLVNESNAVVAGPVDATYNAITGKERILFTDTVTFPIDTHTYTLRGKLPITFANGGTLIASTNPSTDWTGVTGFPSGNPVVISQGLFTMNTMTVKGATFGVSMGSTPVAQNVTAGTPGFTFATILLDTSTSGEDVRIASLPLRLGLLNGALAVNLSGCQLFDGATALNTGSNIPTTLNTLSPTNFSLDNNLVVAKGTVKTLALKCNISASTANGGGYFFSLNAADTVFAIGVTSGSSVAVTNAANNSAVMTVAATTLALSVDSSTPAYMVAAGGTTGVTMGVIKLRATNENVTLTKLGLTLTAGTSAQMGVVSIYDGASLVGTAVFAGNNLIATSTLTTPVTLLNNTDKLLTVKADLADIGPNQPGIDGALVKLDPSSAEGVGQSSGNPISTGATGSVAGVRIYNTFPTFALDTLSSTGIADGKLMRFKVTANASDKLGIGKLSFSVATTNATLTNVQLFAFNDSGYSNAISGQGTSGQIGSTLVSVPNNTTFTMSPDLNPIQVSAGSTLYFELRAVVVGVGAGSSITTTLKGDSFGAPTVGTIPFPSVTDNFVWSPNATTTAATTTGNDWTNGYGVSGLPSGGLLQTRSQ